MPVYLSVAKTSKNDYNLHTEERGGYPFEAKSNLDKCQHDWHRSLFLHMEKPAIRYQTLFQQYVCAFIVGEHDRGRVISLPN